MKKLINVVAAIIIDQCGRILCVQKGETKFQYTSYKYEFPGGKIERDESAVNALAREINEELQVEVIVGDMVKEVIHEYPDFKIRLLAYKCRMINGSVKLSEHITGKWLKPEEMLVLDWCAADWPIVEYLNNIATDSKI